MKIVVVGNCQARPIGKLLESINSDVEITKFAIVHLLKESDEAHYVRYFESADLIIAQLVNDDYPCTFVRTSVLKKSFREKLITINNLFFFGNTPDLLYLRGVTFQGFPPLGSYHSRLILMCWLNQLTIDEAEDILTNKSLNQLLYEDIIKNSLIELKVRELKSDIKISDYITENFKLKRLFYTFNHPVDDLLKIYVARIAKKIGLKINRPKELRQKSDITKGLLGSIIPFYINSNENFEISFEQLQGFNKNGEKHSFNNLKELINFFYDLYERNTNSVTKHTTKSVIFDYSKKALRKEEIFHLNKPITINHPRLKLPSTIKLPNVYVEIYKAVEIDFHSNFKINKTAKRSIPSLGKVLNLFTPGGVVYIHWLLDLLPKFECIAELGINVNNFDFVIVNSKHLNFQKSSLEALKIAEEKILSVSELRNHTWAVDELTMVSPIRKLSLTPYWVIKFIKETFKEKVVSGFGDNIYISREKSRRRKVINELEVQQELKNIGFDVLYCEDYAIGEVHHILNKAKVVCGPHGAGITNIVFCREGTKVIEFFSQHISSDYYLLSQALKLNYYSFPCKDSHGKYFDENELDYENRFFEINFEDIYVDTVDLISFLNKA